MPGCEFGERQYELAANLELLAGNGAFFTPTTSLEAHLGIDAALTPGDPRIWTLLGIQAPAGVAAGPGQLPGWGSASPAPPFLVSLFVQYKRCSYLTRTYAKEWVTHGSSYWRIELSRRQHQTLGRLEVAVGAEGAVRYAAPLFWEHREMWQLQGAGGVLDNSLFVAPSEISPRHTRLTWSRGRGVVGHSEPEEIGSERVRELAADLRHRVEHRPPELRGDVRGHLDSLAAAVAEAFPSRRLRDRLRDDLITRPLIRERLSSEEAIDPLADMAVIAEAASAARASWLIVAIRSQQDPQVES